MTKILNKKISCFCNYRKKNTKLKFEYKKKPKNETSFNLNYKKYYRYYLECINCGHIFGQHKYNLENLYSNDYLKSTYVNINKLKEKYTSIMKLPKNLSDNKNRVSRINMFVKKIKIINKNLLKNGAGIGLFGKSMCSKGWEVYAAETDKILVKYLDNLGLNSILVKKSNKININKNFDLIVFNKVLEHVEKPLLYLKSIKKFLRKNGLVYIEVPDVNAAILGKSREEFFIEHHHIFSNNSLNDMLTKAGFKILLTKSIIEPSGKFTLFSFCMQN